MSYEMLQLIINKISPQHFVLYTLYNTLSTNYKEVLNLFIKKTQTCAPAA